MTRATTWGGRTAQVLHDVGKPVFWASLGCKLAIAVVGIVLVSVPSERWQLRLLIAWCVLSTVYMGSVAIGLVVASRFPSSDAAPLITEISPVARVASVFTALVGVGVGVYAAVQHTLIDKTSPSGFSANLIGIWAMILAWLLLHWGFGQMYLEQYYRFEPRPLEFPHDGEPGVLEFAYLAFTIGVSLAVSDVVVLASRARLLVLAHSVLSFFFNGLIVVTAFAALAELAGLR